MWIWLLLAAGAAVVASGEGAKKPLVVLPPATVTPPSEPPVENKDAGTSKGLSTQHVVSWEVSQGQLKNYQHVALSDTPENWLAPGQWKVRIDLRIVADAEAANPAFAGEMFEATWTTTLQVAANGAVVTSDTENTGNAVVNKLLVGGFPGNRARLMARVRNDMFKMWVGVTWHAEKIS